MSGRDASRCPSAGAAADSPTVLAAGARGAGGHPERVAQRPWTAVSRPLRAAGRPVRRATRDPLSARQRIGGVFRDPPKV